MNKLLEDLNVFLADLNVFYRKLQNYHWNIKGKDFFTIHAKLEEYYDEINEQIDEVAEHILTLGGEPLGRLQDYLEKTNIKEAENKKVDCQEVFHSIVTDMTSLLSNVIQIKEQADNLKEYGTSSRMDEYILEYSKKLWMIKQMMEQ